MWTMHALLDEIFRSVLEQLYKHGAEAALMEIQRRPYKIDDLADLSFDFLSMNVGSEDCCHTPEEYIISMSDDHAESIRSKIDMLKIISCLDLSRLDGSAVAMQDILVRLATNKLIALDDAERFMNAAICMEGHSSFNTCRLQILMIHRLADANEWKRADRWVQQVDTEHLSTLVKASFDRLASRVAQHAESI